MVKKKSKSLNDFIENGGKLKSPRSLEACLRCGLEPEEILPKMPNDFIDKKNKLNDLEREAAQIRFNHFESGRQQKIAMLKKERSKIIKEQKAASEKGSSSSPLSSLTLSPSPGKQKSPLKKDSFMEPLVDSTIVAMEEKRIEKIKLRQEKEIQSLLEMENKMAELAKQNEIREKMELKKKEQWEAERKKKIQEEVAQKHQREIKKKQEEEKETIRRRELAKREAEREHMIIEEEKRKEKIRQKEALEKELERQQKAEEYRKQTESILKSQEDLAMKNRERMLEKERIVQEKMEMATKKKQELAQLKREKAEQRIQEALTQNQAILLKKKEDYDEKQRQAAQRSDEARALELKEIEAKKEQAQKEQELRESRLEAARKLQSDRIHRIVEHRSQLDKHLDEVHGERQKDHILKSVEKNLKLDEKKNNVERIKKVSEFKRLQILQKIANENEKSKQIKERKQALINARKNFALQSILRKHKINEAVEHMQITNNWGSLDKVMEETSPDAKKKTSPQKTNDYHGQI